MKTHLARLLRVISVCVNAIFVNDLEDELLVKEPNGINIGMLKFYLLLYADDIVLIGESPQELQNALKLLEDYCDRWKLRVNTNKTKQNKKNNKKLYIHKRWSTTSKCTVYI